jgi:hypothetical protein
VDKGLYITIKDPTGHEDHADSSSTVMRGSFPGSKMTRGAKLTNYSHLVMRLTTSAATYVLPL